MQTSAADPQLARARGLFQQGRVEEAQEVIETLLAARPDDADVLLLAGRIALSNGDLALAEGRLRRSLDAGTSAPSKARYALGMAAFVAQRHAEARAELDASLEITPGFALARLARAQVATFLGELDLARADLETLRRLEQYSALASVLLAELQLVAGRLEDAIETLQQAAAEERPAASLARSYLTTIGDTPEATARAARRWLDAEPLEARAWFWLGFVTAAAGRPADAEPLLRAALAIDDQHGPAYLTLAALPRGQGVANTTAPGPSTADTSLLPPAYPVLDATMRRMRSGLENDDPAAARSAAREILAARPGHVPALLATVAAAEAAGDLLAALEAARRLDEIAPDLPRLLVRMATLARAVGAAELARDAVERALAVSPDDGNLHVLHATILEAGGDVDGAIAACRRALELGLDTASLHVTLGNLLHQRQQIAAAVAELERAVELDPGAAEHIAAFALTALTTEDHRHVRDILERHGADHPDDINTLYALGTMYLREGELRRARELFERLATLIPDRSEVQYNLAQVYRRQGETERADAARRRFGELKAAEDRQWELHNRAFRRRQQGHAALERGDAGGAVAIFAGLLAGPGAEPGDRVALARARLQAGDPAAALDDFRRALQSPPYEAQTLCDAARAAEAAGAPDDAARWRRQADLFGGCTPETPGAPS